MLIYNKHRSTKRRCSGRWQARKDQTRLLTWLCTLEPISSQTNCRLISVEVVVEQQVRMMSLYACPPVSRRKDSSSRRMGAASAPSVNQRQLQLRLA